MAEDVKRIEENLKKSFQSIREDMNSIKESIASINSKSEEESAKLKEEIDSLKNKEDSPEVSKFSEDLVDLAGYFSELKGDLKDIKESDTENKEISNVRSIVEFNEIKSEISDLKELIENINIPTPKDYSPEISALSKEVDGFNQKVEGVKKLIKDIKFPEQTDYSLDLKELAKEIGEIKGSSINRNTLERESGKIYDKIDERILKIEKDQNTILKKIEDSEKKSILHSLRSEIKALREDAEKERDYHKESIKEVRKEHRKLFEWAEEGNKELKNQISYLKGKLNSLSKSRDIEAPTESSPRKSLNFNIPHNTDSLIKYSIILIPVILVGFIFYSNFIAAHEFNYVYDIGLGTETYLSPADRVSESIIEGDLDYRNLTNGLVYFSIPISKGADNITIVTKFLDNFPKNGKLSLGADDNFTDWHYNSKIIFSKSDSPETTGKWIILEANFSISEDNLAVKDGKLSMYLNVPHLGANETNKMHIPIDWIEATVHKNGIF